MLRPGKDKDVFVACVFVQRNNTAWCEAQQCGAWTIEAVAIKPMDFHPRAKRLPRDFVGVLSDPEELRQLDAGK